MRSNSGTRFACSKCRRGNSTPITSNAGRIAWRTRVLGTHQSRGRAGTGLTLQSEQLKSIDHVNLVVADLPRMLAFYRDVLGFKITKQVNIERRVDWQNRRTDQRLGGGRLPGSAERARIELLRFLSPDAIRVVGVEQPNTIGLRHLAFKVDDINAMTAKLCAAGVEFFSDVQTVPDSQVTYAGGVRKRLVYFRDPEGNILELCEYR